MYCHPWRWTGDGWLGAGLAVAITGLTVVASLWLEAPFVAFVAAVGTPVGALVGGWAGVDVVRSKHPFSLAIRAAAQATLVVVALLVMVAIRIEITPDGLSTVTRDQPFPSDEEFLASAC